MKLNDFRHVCKMWAKGNEAHEWEGACLEIKTDDGVLLYDTAQIDRNAELEMPKVPTELLYYNVSEFNQVDAHWFEIRLDITSKEIAFDAVNGVYLDVASLKGEYCEGLIHGEIDDDMSFAEWIDGCKDCGTLKRTAYEA